MHKNTLREVSKFLSGLIAADFLFGLWFYTKVALPVSFLGINVTPRSAIIWMIFDIVLFIFLVYFGWHIKEELKYQERIFHRLTGTIFGIVALIHLLRIIFGWQLDLFGWNTSYWLSGIGAIVAAFLSYISFQIVNKSHYRG